jgi:hypothetical protein
MGRLQERLFFEFVDRRQGSVLPKAMEEGARDRGCTALVHGSDAAGGAVR